MYKIVVVYLSQKGKKAIASAYYAGPNHGQDTYNWLVRERNDNPDGLVTVGNRRFQAGRMQSVKFIQEKVF